MIIASIPTMPSRVDVLERAVLSLVPQVDAVAVWLNGFDYTQTPAFLYSINKVLVFYPEKDYGSVSRFLVNDSMPVKTRSFVFYCDDDLEYPPDYVEKMLGGWSKYGGIITIHGRLLKRGVPITGWSRENFAAVYPCLENQTVDCPVDIAGSGACMMYSGELAPVPSDFIGPNYDDVELAILAKHRGVKITSLAHRGDWLKYLHPKGDTIWDQTARIGHQPLIDLTNEARLYE